MTLFIYLFIILSSIGLSFARDAQEGLHERGKARAVVVGGAPIVPDPRLQ